MKQYYNSGNKCFMLIDTERKGGIMKASKTPFPDVPIENIGEYLEEEEKEERPEFTLTPDKKGEKENGFYGDKKPDPEDVGKDKNPGSDDSNGWDDFFS